jgi:hypothetical protein
MMRAASAPAPSPISNATTVSTIVSLFIFFICFSSLRLMCGLLHGIRVPDFFAIFFSFPGFPALAGHG